MAQERLSAHDLEPQTAVPFPNDVFHRLRILSSNYLRTSLLVVDPLPGTERSASRTADQQYRPLLLNALASPAALACVVKVPWTPKFFVDREIEREAGPLHCVPGQAVKRFPRSLSLVEPQFTSARSSSISPCAVSSGKDCSNHTSPRALSIMIGSNRFETEGALCNRNGVATYSLTLHLRCNVRSYPPRIVVLNTLGH